MSKIEKLIKRFKQQPADLTFREACKIFNHFGYQLSEDGDGSRVMFTNGVKKFRLHKPHGSNTMKKYQIKDMLEFLEKEENL